MSSTLKTLFRKFVPVLLVVLCFGPLALGAPTEVHAQASNDAAIQGYLDAQQQQLRIFEGQIDAGCGLGKDATITLNGCLAWIAYKIFKGAYNLALLVSKLLNWVVQELVFAMGLWVGNMTGVIDAWEVLRDLANVFLVFLTIFVGIATIVGISGYGYKQLLFRIILAALLVNFSITFAKVVIDVSNLATGEIFKNIVAQFNTSSGKNINLNRCVDDPNGAQTWKVQIGTEQVSVCENLGVAAAFWSAMKMTTIFNANDFASQAAAAKGAESTASGKIITVSTMGTLFFLILAFVLAVAAFLLLARFVILVFLIIMSPIAFVMWITGISSSGSRWWHSLLSQSFFAPALFLMWWISLRVLTTAGTRLNVAGTSLAKSSFGNVDDVGIVLYFVICIGFIAGSLILAKQMGAYGANASISTGKRLMGGAYAVTGGAIAARTLNAYNRTLAMNENRRKGQDEEHAKAEQAARSRLASARVAGNRRAETMAEQDLDVLRQKKIARSTGRSVIDRTIGKGTLVDRKIAGGLKKAADFSYAGAESHTQAEAAKEARQKEVTQGARKDEMKGAIKGNVDDSKRMRLMAQATTRDAEELHDTLMGNVERAVDFNASTFEGIMKSDKFSEADKKQLMQARYENAITVLTGAATTDPGEIEKERKELAKLGRRDIELLANEVRGADASKLQLMSADQANQVMDSNYFTDTQKGEFKGKYYGKQIAGITSGDKNVVKSLKEHEMVALRDELATNASVVGDMSADQFGTLMKNKAFSDTERQKFKNARFKDANEAIEGIADAKKQGNVVAENTARDELRIAMKKVTDAEAEYMGDMLDNTEVIESMSQGLVNKLLDSPKVNAGSKDKVRTVRKDYFKRNADAGTIGPVLQNMKPADIAKGIDADILRDTKTVKHMNSAILAELPKELNVGARNDIRTHVATMYNDVSSGKSIAQKVAAGDPLSADEDRIAKMQQYLDNPTVGAIF